MIEVVTASKLRTDREPSLDDDLGVLKESLLESGLIVPLLVNSDMIVVDGVRRLAAIKSLGLTEVAVQVTEDFDVAVINLARARKEGVGHRELSPYATYRQYLHISKMGMARLSRRRGIGQTVDKNGHKQYIKNLGSFDEEYRTAVGINESRHSFCTTSYRALASLEPGYLKDRYKEILDSVERGEIGFGRAETLLREARANPSRQTAEQQAKMLRSSISTMEGMLQGLLGISTDLAPGIDQAEVDAWIVQAKSLGTRLTVMRNRYQSQRKATQ